MKQQAQWVACLCLHIIIICFFGTGTAQAQSPEAGIYLHGGPPIYADEIPTAARSAVAWPANNCSDDRCYAVVQFYDLPTPADVAELAEQGVTLHEYLPRYAYLASAPADLPGFSAPSAVRALIALDVHHKHPAIDLTGGGSAEGEGQEVQVWPFTALTLTQLGNQIREAGFVVDAIGESSLFVTVLPNQWDQLLSLPAVMYVEPLPGPPVPDGVLSRTQSGLHRINRGPGLGYDGAGITIGIGDDGRLRHLDLRGRVIDFTTNTGNGPHGEMTAGLALGAGNLNPWATGMAPAARLLSFDIGNYEYLTQAPAHLAQYRMVITSTSYSEGCGGYYSTLASQLDQQVLNYPSLLHCFSAGNSAGDVCQNPYGAFTTFDNYRFGNITGGRKAAKNVLVVGNVYYDDELRGTSSRGPALDGRIKPDICAPGQGFLTLDENNLYRLSSGTSAASPTVAGIAACLYQRYRQLNADADPPSSLVKCALLNGAEDLGQPGPDYSFGWGRVDAARSMNIIENSQYRQGSVAHGFQQFHQVNVPAGVKEVRMMLYWHDRPGSPLAAQSLVNDLDFKVTGPAGQLYLPWTPSAYAHADSLNLPAFARPDRVNNAEQVVFSQPMTGMYTLQVFGYLVPQGPQPYVITYTFVYDDLILTYPLPADALLTNESHTVRWEAWGDTSPFALDFSNDGGANWQPVASNIPGHQRHFDWTTPASATAQARLRLRRGSQTTQSANHFVVSPTPQVSVSYVDNGTARVTWAPTPLATSYEVLVLGDQFMEVVGTVNSTTWLMPATSGQTYWLSVRPILPGGLRGARSLAQSYTHQGCDQVVNLFLNFDQYPAETSWQIRTTNGVVVTSGGPYLNQAGGSTLTEVRCIPAGCYILEVFDAYADGMCCNQGNGSFALTNQQGLILATGGSFGASSVHTFCVGNPGSVPLTISSLTSGPVPCAGSAGGWVQVVAAGGSGTYTYQWSNGAQTAYVGGLPAGAYQVTVNDGAQTATGTVTVGSPALLLAAIQTTPASCQNGAFQVQVVGGTAPYQIQWNDGATGAQRTGLAAGVYTLTVTDARGCVLPLSAAMPLGPPLQLSLQLTHPSCAQSNNGAVTATVTGGRAPYTYAWSSGPAGPQLSNLGGGVYTLTVTDAGGCVVQSGAILVAPTPLTLNVSSQPQTGQQGGSVSAAVGGGTPPYQYLWNNGATSAQLTNLAAGVYQLTVVDAAGCNISGSAVVVQAGGQLTYCNSRGSSTSFEWIQQVNCNGVTYTSGNNGGYALFTNPNFVFQIGQSNTIALSPGYTANQYQEHWRVYLDYNRDGDFTDPGETVVVAGPSNQTITTSVVVPAGIAPGLTRMRVSMQYGAAPTPCGLLGYGEVEDYQVMLAQPSGANNGDNAGLSQQPDHEYLEPAPALADEQWRIFPNPVGGDELWLQRLHTVPPVGSSTGFIELRLLNSAGQVCRVWQPTSPDLGERLPVDLQGLPAGLYWLEVNDGIQPQPPLRFLRM